MNHISKYTEHKQILMEALGTAQTDFNDAENEVDRAMRNLQIKKVALAQAQKELQNYEEKRNQPDTEVSQDDDSF